MFPQKNQNLLSVQQKTLWEEEKILITSIFSFSNKVFKRFFFRVIYPLLHIYSFRRINTRQLLKTCGEGNFCTRNKQFLLFPQCFLPVWKTFCHFHQTWNCLKLFQFGRVQNLPFGKGLTHSHTVTPFDAPGKQGSFKLKEFALQMTISNLTKMAESPLNW